jgi:hypothetical protein
MLPGVLTRSNVKLIDQKKRLLLNPASYKTNKKERYTIEKREFFTLSKAIRLKILDGALN